MGLRHSIDSLTQGRLRRVARQSVALRRGRASSTVAPIMRATPGDNIPSPLARPLEQRFWELNQSTKPESRAQWHRYLAASNGKPVFVPIGTFDPGKELVVLAPGTGMNFHDIYALQDLKDTYQVVVLVADISRPGSWNATKFGEELSKLIGYRKALARARGLTEPTSEPLIIGHSYGSFLSPLALGRLARKGKLDSAEGGLFSRVRFWGLDGPWAGQDVPWLLTLRPIEAVLKPLLYWRRPKGHDPKGVFSILNRTTVMDEFRNTQLPKIVETQLVTTVRAKQAAPKVPPKPAGLLGRLLSPFKSKFREPVDNWLAAELAPGELERVWRFLRSGSQDAGKLESWEFLGLVKKQRLSNLWLALKRDADFTRYEPELRRAAKNAKTVDDFAPRWDELIRKIVNTFEGPHTEFMWQDPTFMPWLRKSLAGS